MDEQQQQNPPAGQETANQNPNPSTLPGGPTTAEADHNAIEQQKAADAERASALQQRSTGGILGGRQQNPGAPPPVPYGDYAKTLVGGQTSVADSAESVSDHVEAVGDAYTELEKAVNNSGAGEHTEVKSLMQRVREGFHSLLQHVAHHEHVAQRAHEQIQAGANQAAPATTTAAPAPPRSTATSDAHLNRGNGGAVTGNPGASYSQASAAQMAVEQGAPLPGVATVPQPDAHVR